MKKNFYKYNVLCTWKIVFPVLKKYKKFFKKNRIKVTKINVGENASEKILLKIINKYDGVIAGDDQFTKKVLSKAKKLKVISKWGTGLDSIDINAAKKANIKVYNTPDAFSKGVSQLALGMILVISRDILNTHLDLKSGIWSHRTGFLLDKKTIGIFGLGKIGLKTSEMLKGFNVKILGNDIKKIEKGVLKKYKIKKVSKNKLLTNSDIIILCVNLNKTSIGLINSKEFNLMKKKPVLINICRGRVINEKALIKALEQKKILGAGLDVFEKEPISKKNKLLQFKNCIFSTHNAFNTAEDVNKVNDNTIKNLVRGIENRA